MSDRPILFIGAMVRAILEGRKTQTRRVLKPQPSPHRSGIPGLDCVGDFYWPTKTHGCGIVSNKPFPPEGYLKEFPLKFAPGDRLWVREHWRTVSHYEELAPSDMGGEEPIRFEADGSWQRDAGRAEGSVGRHRQGMHMPRWASRLTLTVTDVRVQRLQEVSEADAIAEGVAEVSADWQDCDEPAAFPSFQAYGQDACFSGGGAARLSFMTLWDSLNSSRGFGWEANPWVVAVSFEAHRCNIDQMEQDNGK